MASHMAALMQTPGGHSDTTITGHGKTLPDISLGSLGSSFRSEDMENGPAKIGIGAQRPQVARYSPDSVQTPPPPTHFRAPTHPSSHADADNTFSRPSSSQNVPQSNAPRRNRMLRSAASISSMSSASVSDAEAERYGALDGRYDVGGSDDESDAAAVLTNLSINVTPGATAALKNRGGAEKGGPGKRGGRVSVAPAADGPMTLREQEQELDAVKKDNFNLQLENHFLKERLSNMAPDHIESALKENVKLKLEILNLSKEMKKLKKLVMQQDKDLADAQRERGSGGVAGKEMERMYLQEKDKRERLEGELGDVREQVEKIRDERDRLEEEVEGLQRGAGISEEVEDQLNEMRDQLAAAELDLQRRDQEIEELNGELDAKIREHENEIGQVEAEWKDEVLQTREQLEELKDTLEAREQETKDLRLALLERTDDLSSAHSRIQTLETEKADTADHLEETLKNIERDNVEKEADLEAANREVEELGQRVYELEELAEEMKAREEGLVTELQGLDDEKMQYESLISALKEARAKLQVEAEERGAAVEAAERARKADRLKWQDEVDRAVHEKDTELARLKQEMEDAKDRVARGDRELKRVKEALVDAEERRTVSGQYKEREKEAEVEIQRLRRDVRDREEEVEGARDALERRDKEYSDMLDRQRDLQDALSAERQARLTISDKLDEAVKLAKRHEREATSLRDRLTDLEPRLSQSQRVTHQAQKQSEQQQLASNELLLQVFMDLNKFLGVEDHHTPAEFPVFRETLLSRLRSVNRSKGDTEKKFKEQEAAMESRMASLKRQLEQKWRALDTFESSVKKLELTRTQWRQKYALKDGELEAARSRIAELNQHLSAQRSGLTASSNSHLRSLTERAERAEKQALKAANQLAQYEERVAQLQAKSGVADDKWEARVKEYENRLRIAGEKIKTEKQGGRERVAALEAQIRDLEKQVEVAKKRNIRAENVVASADAARTGAAEAMGSGRAHAAHLMPRSGSTASSRGNERP